MKEINKTKIVIFIGYFVAVGINPVNAGVIMMLMMIVIILLEIYYKKVNP